MKKLAIISLLIMMPAGAAMRPSLFGDPYPDQGADDCYRNMTTEIESFLRGRNVPRPNPMELMRYSNYTQGYMAINGIYNRASEELKNRYCPELKQFNDTVNEMIKAKKARSEVDAYMQSHAGALLKARHLIRNADYRKEYFPLMAKRYLALLIVEAEVNPLLRNALHLLGDILTKYKDACKFEIPQAFLG